MLSGIAIYRRLRRLLAAGLVRLSAVDEVVPFNSGVIIRPKETEDCRNKVYDLVETAAPALESNRS
jgi:hypothetical protein